jgi:hypothetical protein
MPTICRCTVRNACSAVPANPRSTLAEWVGACGVQLQPLVDALRNTLLEHSVLHADETPVSMLAREENPQGLRLGLPHRLPT